MDFYDSSDKTHTIDPSITLAMANVALVVGAGSNIGYQVLKKLTKVYHQKIYFTTEDDTSGFKILDMLKKDGLDLVYLKMDITDTNNIIKVRYHVQDNDERIDLLINNTEYVVNQKKLPIAEKVRRTLSVNFYGMINFGKLIYPLLTDNARVVNVSGAAGLLRTIENEEIRKRISNPNLTEDELVGLLQEYEMAVRKGIEKIEGWGLNVQSVSKVALNALTFLQHREWCDKGIVINCVNPGNLQTKDDRKNKKVFEKGAKAILYLALEAPLSIKGNFVWSNFSVIEWNCDPYVEVSTV